MKRRLLAVLFFVLGLALARISLGLAQPPEPTAVADSRQLGSLERKPGHIRLEGVEKPQRAPISVSLAAQGWTRIMTEDFEEAFPGPKWDLYGDPTWGRESYRRRTGIWSSYCAGGGTNGVNPPGPYHNDMNAWMVYGPFDLSGATDAELLFYHWTKTEEGDEFWVVASTDFEDWWGTSWSGDWAGECGGWCEVNFGLTNVGDLGNLAGQPEVWIAFAFQSDSSVTDEGTYVDDIALRAYVGGTDPMRVKLRPQGLSGG